jgi:DNA-binding CsgD family transcriptional regulator
VTWRDHGSGWNARPARTDNGCVLVGREAECARIGDALSLARGGSSSVLLVRGEPGIGKSALLQHAAEQARGLNVLTARGVESEAEIPFAGLLQLVRPALPSLEQVPAQQAAALRGALALGPTVRSDRFVIGAATLSLLAAYAEQAPCLVLIDDAQWLDASSADAVVFAFRRLLADRIAVLLAVRDGEVSLFDNAGLAELAVGGLDPDAAKVVLQQRAASPVTSDTAEWLCRATGGNPLALVELAAEAPQLEVELFERPLAVGPRVQHAFRRQIARLSDQARTALVVAAASESGEMLAIVGAMGVLGLVTRGLEEAESATLVRIQDDVLEFRHPLVRSAAYQSGPPAERRRAHQALAEALTGAGDADRRAWHLASALLGPSDDVAAVLEAAAQRAQERSAYAAAASAFERAAHLTTADEARARRLLAAADAAWLAGAVERARRLLEEARNQASEPRLRARIEHLRGLVAMRTQPMLVSCEILLGAATAIEATDPGEATVLLAEAAANGFMYAGLAERMLATARRAWHLAQVAGTDEATYFGAMALGQALIVNGQGAEGAQLVRRGLAIMEASETLWRNPRLVQWTARARLFLRETATGGELLQRALDAAREQGAVGVLPVALNQLALDSATSDRWAQAHAQYAEGISLARETGQTSELCADLAGLCRLEARQGRAEDCRAHAAETLVLADQLDLGLFRIYAYLALTQLELGLGRFEDAIQQAQSVTSVLLELGIEDPDLSASPDVVEAYLRGGRVSEARTAALDYERRADEKRLPWPLARAERCRGLLADEVSYDRHFGDALRHHDVTPDSFERGRTHLCYGERLRRSRRRVEARGQLRAAFEAFERLGAEPWAERARIELLATGETARRRDASGLEQLTPQEFQIAQMLAAGATTREAAARLFLSPKTIEYHLRSVYGKFAISSRSELAVAMGDDGRGLRIAASP